MTEMDPTLKQLVNMGESEFSAADFLHVAQLLRNSDEKVVRASLSNWCNAIIAALEIAARDASYTLTEEEIRAGWVSRGATCPVPLSRFVDVLWRDGDTSECVAAGGLPWATRGMETDIVAYRTVPAPGSEPAETIKAAYFEGFGAASEGGEQLARRYAEKNWPYSQAGSDAALASADIGSLSEENDRLRTLLKEAARFYPKHDHDPRTNLIGKEITEVLSAKQSGRQS